jgi:hypothetical protein
MDERHVGPTWYCVRTVFRFHRPPITTYEERLTLWSATGFPAAIASAEEEAHAYADSLDDCAYVGLAQAYELTEAPGHGAEVFSLMRDSTLTADAYVNAFFDTGDERQGDSSAVPEGAEPNARE